jgi:hypothetical protein
MRGQQGLKLMAVVALAAMGPAGASERETRASSADCPDQHRSMLGGTVVGSPGEGSLFDFGRRSPLLMP